MLKEALGSTAFFFAAPCVVGGLLPWAISGWAAPRFWPGLVLVAAGRVRRTPCLRAIRP
ncbi:hypothetical protein AB0L70_13895 [Kribbella sp. NPDC051952]|uniref:hypothetical protein n=1 Tax=Kribbella sp. NPDC051952 TaxID=3154851 RepID=UPI00341AB77C